MADPTLRRIRDLLRRQDGVITRKQAVGSGFSDRRVDRMMAKGDWIAVHPGVLHRADAELTMRGRTRAAVLWAGEGAVLSGAAAAFWWGMTRDAPEVVEVIVPPHRHPRPRAGVRVVRRDLDPVDVRDQYRLRVLDLPMAALRGAVALGKGGPALLDRQLQQGLPIELVRSAYHRQLGWHGSARAGELVRVAGDGAAAESERIFHRLLASAGVDGWQTNASVLINGRMYRPDVSFEELRLAIEIDGWAWHSTPERFRADRRRDNDFLLAGWRVLRFTWHDLTGRPRDVIREVRRAITGQ